MYYVHKRAKQFDDQTRLIFNPALDGSGRRRGLSRAQYACVRRGDLCLLTGLPRGGLGRRCA